MAENPPPERHRIRPSPAIRGSAVGPLPKEKAEKRHLYTMYTLTFWNVATLRPRAGRYNFCCIFFLDWCVQTFLITVFGQTHDLLGDHEPFIVLRPRKKHSFWIVNAVCLYGGLQVGCRASG